VHELSHSTPHTVRIASRTAEPENSHLLSARVHLRKYPPPVHTGTPRKVSTVHVDGEKRFITFRFALKYLYSLNC
jgi:hypothetical protein